MSEHRTIRSFLAGLVAAVALAGCGGGGVTTVGGSVSGLVTGTAVTLQLNGRETLAVAANGSFEFTTELGATDSYNVVVLIQPVRATCTVANGSGNIDNNASKVRNITVTCVQSHSLGGIVQGLTAGTQVVLQNNGIDSTTVSANGSFTMGTLVPTGSSYNIGVGTQPNGHTCTVTQGGNGTVQSADVTNIVITCT